MKLKMRSEGQYQYAEAAPQDAEYLRSFGWLFKKGPLHENNRGNKVVSLRRFIEFAYDSEIVKTREFFEEQRHSFKKTRRDRSVEE